MKWSDFERELLDDPEVREAYEEEVPRQRLALSLAHKRHALGMSQHELARRARVTQRQVSALENGKANVTLDTLLRVTGALGLVLNPEEKVIAFTSATTSPQLPNPDFTKLRLVTTHRSRFAATKTA